MKNSYFNFVYLSSILFVLSYCKDKENTPTPTATASIAYTPIVSWTKAGQVPLIYEGDTIKYNITATASADITELNVYKVDAATETKTLLPGYPKTIFADKKNITDHVYVPVGAKADFKAFYLSIETKEGSAVRILATNKYTLLSEVTLQKDLRISLVGSSYNAIESYSFSSNQNVSDYNFVLTLILSNNLIVGFGSISSGTLGNVQQAYNYSAFVKWNSLYFDGTNKPDDIKDWYINTPSSERKYRHINISVDDVFSAKFNPVYNDTISVLPTYGLLKITEIVTSGTDNDYIKFDAKLYNPFRFK